MSAGVIAADMQHDWATDAIGQRAAALAAAPAEAPEPVVVTRTRVRHVTPDPVVVHKKVYRIVPGQAAAGARAGAKAGTSTGGTTPRAAAPGGSTRSSRTVVAPAPAPAKARTKAPAATTSKTS